IKITMVNLVEFATKKAERANLRVLMRDKYRIPQVIDHRPLNDQLDENFAEKPLRHDSFLGKLQNMDVDFDSIKAKAQSTMTEVKQAAEEKCVMM
uniref:Uncharacterized protein n=1 Tax=Sinocyclocheilus rhinocerous TaxID=307959 RepID=A0A673GUT8_9TELE